LDQVHPTLDPSRVKAVYPLPGVTNTGPSGVGFLFLFLRSSRKFHGGNAAGPSGDFSDIPVAGTGNNNISGLDNSTGKYKNPYCKTGRKGSEAAFSISFYSRYVGWLIDQAGSHLMRNRKE